MKKVLSPLLSALLLAGCAAGTDVPTVQPTAAPETPDTAQSSETAETAGAAAAPQGLIPTDAPVLDYDDIRLIAYVREFQTYPDTDYYTMCRDGKWGLMRSDGTEVLPCRAPYPLFECGWNAHRWHGYTDGMTWEEIEPLQEQLNAQLKETGDGVLCDAHDGGGPMPVQRPRRRHRTHGQRHDHPRERRLVQFRQRRGLCVSGQERHSG